MIKEVCRRHVFIWVLACGVCLPAWGQVEELPRSGGEAAGAEQAWVPVAATGGNVVGYAGATAVCAEPTTVQLEAGYSYQVEFELRLAGWGTLPGSPALGTYQATVDSTGFGDMTPISGPHNALDGCLQGIKLCHDFDVGSMSFIPCDGDYCDVWGPGDPACPSGDPSCSFCQDNPYFVFTGILATKAVSTATPNYVWGATTFASQCRTDPGCPSLYGGTLILEVPESARGYYPVSFVRASSATFLNNCGGSPMQGVLLTSGAVEMITGACCTRVPGSDPICEDGLSAADCGASAPPDFFLGETCDFPFTCPVCENDADCDDGLSCTQDTCNLLSVCEHTVQAGFCAIDGKCYTNGTVNPRNACEVCAAVLQPTFWSPRPPGTFCGDAVDDECTDPDTCDEFGTCLGNHASDGTPCPNEYFCDGNEYCQSGVCQGGDPPCDSPGLLCDEVNDECYCAQGDDCRVRYVDDDATGPSFDGSDWCSAFTDLQDALDAAVASQGTVNEIRVAAGVYQPSAPYNPFDPRVATFQLINGVTVEGAYAGCGAIDPDERDAEAHPTILSGARGDPVNWDNCYHVITADASIIDSTGTVLDGLLITAGYAEGIGMDGSGGGMWINGGGPMLVNCTFLANDAANTGGGLYGLNASPLLTGCSFVDNAADLGGGGMTAEGGAPELDGCAFVGNEGRRASYAGPGGGFRSMGAADPVLRNCLFLENVADAGGGLAMDVGHTTIANCTFAENTALDQYGGGLFISGASPDATLAVTNAILWNNNSTDPDAELRQLWPGAGDLTVNHSCVEGWSSDFGGVGNHGLDPLFVVGPGGCHYMSQTVAGQAYISPCVDAGSGTAGDLGLTDRTTRTDEGPDEDEVDMGYHYPITGQTLVMGDSNRDGFVCLADYADLPECLPGPGVAIVAPCCGIFDFDADGDVDLRDIRAFQIAFTGP